VEGRIRLVLGRRKLDTQINKLHNHFIICGYGRIGRELARFLIAKYLNVVVIEREEARVGQMDDDGVLYLIGEATDEKVLKRAGIERAKGLITAVATDADNVFLVLIARQINPKLFIVARAGQNDAKKTLTAAGARRMAHAILRPTVIKFLEMAFADDKVDIQVEEITIRPASELVGMSIVDSGIRSNFDLMIIVIRKPGDDMVFNPKADTVIAAGDTMVVVGSARNIKRLERIA
jgi:voltage-gated potassium channel